MALKFKTNINCGGCIEKVTPPLNATVGEGNWEVDTSSKDRILTIKNETISAQQVIDALKIVNYKAEVL